MSESGYTGASGSHLKGSISSDAPLLPGPYSPKHSRIRYFGRLVDAILVLVAVSFIAFAFLVLQSHGRPLTDNSKEQALLLAASYGPTVFPVVFAAIAGRTLKALATWNLQNGTTIGRVEQLLGSHTLVGSVVTQIELRAFGWVGLGLLVLWTLSPLGSQATLRIAYSKARDELAISNVSTIDPLSEWTVGSSGSSQVRNLVTTLFTSGLVSAGALLNQTQDVFGNLRVPMIEMFEGYADGHWIDIPSDASGISWASLIGTPFSSTFTSGSTTFTVNTSYVAMNCPSWTRIPNARGYFNPVNFSIPSQAPALQSKYDYWWSAGKEGPNGYQITMSNCLAGCSLYINDTEEIRAPRDARRLIWESGSANATDHIDCTLQTTHTEVQYNCTTASDCHATGIRMIPNQHTRSYFWNSYINHAPFEISENSTWLAATDAWNERNFTTFDVAGWNIGNFLDLLTTLFDVQSSHSIDPIMRYLIEPLASFDDTSYLEIPYYWPGMASVGRKAFEARLGQLVNTMLMSGISPLTTARLASVTNTTETSFEFLRLDTTATTTTKREVFVCDKVWFSIVLIISAFVLVLAAGGATLKLLTLVPDVLGTLAIATLDNRCHELPNTGSMLDGLERSRYLSKVGIRLADVEPAQPTGRVALVAPLREVPAAILDNWRMYD